MRHPTDNRVHFSELKQMARSPAHYAHACEHAKDPSRAMTVGAVGDAIVFGTPDRIAIYPGPTRRGKEWDAFKALNPGKTIAIQSEVDDATGRPRRSCAIRCRADPGRVRDADRHPVGTDGDAVRFRDRRGTGRDRCAAPSEPHHLGREVRGR